MGTQIITIKPDGTIEGLQRKKGEGVDLRKLGHAKIRRASEIVWEEDEQMWFIRVLTPDQYPTVVLWAEMREADIPVLPDRIEDCVEVSATDGSFINGIPYFAEYDDAVKAEIAYLDYCRVRNLDPTTFEEKTDG